MQDVPYQGSLKIRNKQIYTLKTNVLSETTGPPTGQEEEIPNDLNLPSPPISELLNDDQEGLFCNEERTSDSLRTILDSKTPGKKQKIIR